MRVLAWTSYLLPATIAFPAFHGDPFERYTISTAGIKATFIPYGARLTNLLVSDKHDRLQDVVMGYDTGEQYVQDTATAHSYMGAVVGRYANRIKDGTFDLDGNAYHIPKNGANMSTLHGGTIGYDQRNWTVVSHDSTSITFSLYDPGFEGFPGDVLNLATYTVTHLDGERPTFTSRLISIPLTHSTPIMLSNHIYWNLGAFINSAAQTIYDNTLHLPFSKRYIEVTPTSNISGKIITNQVPNGRIGLVKDTFLDFLTPRLIGSQILNGPKDFCGANCTGYNTGYIIDRVSEDPDLTMSSPQTGIRMDMKTNMQSLEIFSCNWFNGSIIAKADQGVNSTYGLHGCFVVEPQGWISGINYPEWGQEGYQIFGPDTQAAVNLARYEFSIVEDGKSEL